MSVGDGYGDLTSSRALSIDTHFHLCRPYCTHPVYCFDRFVARLLRRCVASAHIHLSSLEPLNHPILRLVLYA